MSSGDAMADPTRPGRTYVIDEIFVHEYDADEIASHATVARAIGAARPLDWTHFVRYRWHAEEAGVRIFGASGSFGITHRGPGSAEETARLELRAMILPLPRAAVREEAEWVELTVEDAIVDAIREYEEDGDVDDGRAFTDAKGGPFYEP